MKLWMAVLMAASAPVIAQAAPVELASPDGRVAVVLDQDLLGVPTYAVRWRGEQLIAPSPMGLELAGEDPVGPSAKAGGVERAAVDGTYAMVAGKSAIARDHYNQIIAHFTTPAGRPFDIIVRAYDDGVALRYRLPTRGDQPVTIAAESTRFLFPADYGCWGLNLGRFGTSHEGEYDPINAARIRDGNLYEVPLLCETKANGPAFALAEADLQNWSGLYLTGQKEGGTGISARLSPRLDDPLVAVRTLIGADVRSPWRVVMVADSAVNLIGSTLIAMLNPATTFETGWVKPGKTAWDWWNGPALASVPKAGMNDATIRGFIDFAADKRLEYMMIDDGWYLGSGLAGTVRPGSDATRSIPAIDLPGLVAYGKQRNVGLWLWIHWRVMDAQMDKALSLYERLGIKGIKVDFMDRDDQQMVDFVHCLLAKAAAHHLMVDLHGMYHPTGLSRTYPNLMTQEGVMGAEFNKWSSRVTATHNVTLPFTRMLLGSMDYTPGGFRNVTPAAFKPNFDRPVVQTTQAHGMAMYVVYESTLASVADSPDVYRARDGMDFIAAVPASWDETRPIAGHPGSHIVVARRKGSSWWLGAMTNEEARTVNVPLTFLAKGRYRATIYGDGATPTTITTQIRDVTAADTLDLALAGSGGAAVRFIPIGTTSRRKK
ncbi:glycoside hydrolase family 97 protein [soil metagenome]